MVGKRAPTPDRFLAKFDTATPDKCWEWKANTNGAGYGLLWSLEHGRKVLAHRYSYEYFVGPLRDDELILHSCDNPACVNPAHLRVGTHKQNVADMDLRGRRNTTPLLGVENPNAVLTAEQVTALRIDYCAGAGRAELASKYGVSPLSIHDYVSGGAWAHLLGKDGSPTLADLQAQAKKNSKPSATLTPEIVREIRTELSRGAMGIDLAAKYGVHKATISDIKLRKIWADVD